MFGSENDTLLSRPWSDKYRDGVTILSIPLGPKDVRTASLTAERDIEIDDRTRT